MKTIKPILNNEKQKEKMRDINALIFLAEEVYDKRKKMGINQQGLAKKVGTTQRIISNIENAEINVGFNLLIRIAHELNIEFKIGDSYFAKEKKETREKKLYNIVNRVKI